MSERVAIVAGAGSELGRSTAEKLAAAGFTAVGVDRSEERLKDLPDGIRREAAVNAVAPQLLNTARNRTFLTPELLPHAVAPEAIADIIVYLVSDAAAPISGAVVPAYGP
jgi:NAD(P)-dependent dehydrogenase (short-subunit alcohol dehydrogenase family)